ncbi:hypothetical protein AB4254_12245 [Vibrio breoganii]
MGRTMLHGILKMPIEIWDVNDSIDALRRHERYREASEVIMTLDREVLELRKYIKELESALSEKH